MLTVPLPFWSERGKRARGKRSSGTRCCNSKREWKRNKLKRIEQGARRKRTGRRGSEEEEKGLNDEGEKRRRRKRRKTGTSKENRRGMDMETIALLTR